MDERGTISPIVGYTYFLDSSRVTILSSFIFNIVDSFQITIENGWELCRGVECPFRFPYIKFQSSIYLYIYLSMHLSIYLSACLSVYLSIYLSI